MKLFTKLLLTAALTTGFASAPASAGPFDIIKNKAKAEAKKEAKKKAKEEAAAKIVEMTGTSESTAATAVDGTEKVLEMTGVVEKEPAKDKSLMGKAMDAAMDGMKKDHTSEDMAGESHDHDKMDEMTDHAESTKKDDMMDMAEDAMKMKDDHAHDADHDHDKMKPMDGDKVMEKAAPALPPVACPAGTTAQADGTCMITGDFDSSE